MINDFYENIYNNLILVYNNFIKKEEVNNDFNLILNNRISNIEDNINILNIEKDEEKETYNISFNELNEKKIICNMYNDNLNKFIINLKNKLLLFTSNINTLIADIDTKNNKEVLDIYNNIINCVNILKNPDDLNYQTIEIVDNIYIEEYYKCLKNKQNADTNYKNDLDKIIPIEKNIKDINNNILLLHKEKNIIENFQKNISNINISDINNDYINLNSSFIPLATPVILENIENIEINKF